MVAVTLMGRTFDVAPYSLGQMRRAAPFVDSVNAAMGSLTTMEGGIAVASDLAAFVAIGLEKLDPALTADALDDKLGWGDLPALQAAFRDILLASGLKMGEAKAPPAPADAAAA